MTTLASLALLKTRFDVEHTDFLDSFRPFVIYVVLKEGFDEFTAHDMQAKVLGHFGLAIPHHAVDLVLRRMSKAGQLTRAENTFRPQKIDFDMASFERHRAEATQHQNATEAGLIDYARAILGVAMTSEEADSALNEYIDQYSIECISAYAHGSIVPVHGKSNKHWPYIVSSYVNALSEKEPDKFRYLVTVVMGRMLSNALLGQDLTAIQMKFHDTCVYLDTPIVLQLLGALGDAPKLLAEEMLTLLRRSKADVAIFEHVANEVDQVLGNAQNYLEKNGPNSRGNVIAALRQLGYTASDVAMLRSSVSSHLSNYGITVSPTPPYVQELQVDEISIEKEMENAELFYRADLAKKVDISSIRSIYVLRKGRCPSRVEDCRAIFVTNNHGLARAAYAYGKNHEETRELSSVITDFSLTNLLWLKAPLDYVDVPRRMIAVNCYAALHPSDEFWAAFLVQLDQLHKNGRVTALQHQFLRYELRVREDLMNLTLGDENSLTEKQILQVVDRYEHELTQPLHDKVSVLEDEMRTVRTDRDEMRARLAAIDSRIAAFASAVRKMVAIVLVITALMLILVAHGWLGGNWRETLDQPWKGALYAGVYVVDAYIVLHLFIHVSIWNPVSKVAGYVENFLITAVKGALGYQENRLDDLPTNKHGAQ